MEENKITRLGMNDAYDAERFREDGIRLVNRLADYLENCQTRQEDTVFTSFDPDDLARSYEEIMERVPEEGLDMLADRLLADSIKLHHPHYMGHQVSPVLPYTALGEFLGGFMNNGVGVFEMGSPAVALEHLVIQKMARAVGFGQDAGGFLTSGGSLGNLTALLCARQVMSDHDIWSSGLQNEQLSVLVSEQLHYSVERAIMIMGWGSEGLVKIPTDSHYKMDLAALEQAYRQECEKGRKVIAVVGGACTTASGTFDPLKEIGAFCKKHRLWFHVDAAHGGAAIFSNRFRSLLSGIEHADSVIIDLHKMMMHPALVTAVLFRDGNNANRTFHQRADYLWELNKTEWYNLGKKTFECTKSMMSVKAAITFSLYGEEVFGEIVDRLFGLARLAGQMIREYDEFEIAAPVESNIVCFRYYDPEVSDNDLNELNRNLRAELIKRGNFFIVQTLLDDIIYLRMSLMNVATDTEDLKELLTEIRTVANTL